MLCVAVYVSQNYHKNVKKIVSSTSAGHAIKNCEYIIIDDTAFTAIAQNAVGKRFD